MNNLNCCFDCKWNKYMKGGLWHVHRPTSRCLSGTNCSCKQGSLCTTAFRTLIHGHSGSWVMSRASWLMVGLGILCPALYHCPSGCRTLPVSRFGTQFRQILARSILVVASDAWRHRQRSSGADESTLWLNMSRVNRQIARQSVLCLWTFRKHRRGASLHQLLSERELRHVSPVNHWARSKAGMAV